MSEVLDAPQLEDEQEVLERARWNAKKQGVNTDNLPPGKAEYPWILHPLKQCYWWRTPPLHAWQQYALYRAAMPGAASIVSTCNASGKTNYLIPVLGLSAMVAFPGCTVFSTAGAEEQIEGQLYRYLENMLRPWTGDMRSSAKDKWQVSPSGLWVRAPEIRGLRSRWISRVPKDALTMEGYHGHWELDSTGKLVWCPVLVIIDEAKSLADAVFQAAYRIDPDWLFVTSTPGDPDTPFVKNMQYESLVDETIYGYGNTQSTIRIARSTDQSSEMYDTRMQIRLANCPHLLTGRPFRKRQALMKKYGQRSAFIQSFIFGESSDVGGANRVFQPLDMARLRDLMYNEEARAKVQQVGNDIRAAADFSGGGDEQTLYIRQGNTIIHWETWNLEDTDELAKLMVATARRFGVPAHDFWADNGGLGKSIIDSMEGTFNYPGIVRYYSNNARVNNPAEFKDTLAEDTYHLKEIIHNPGIRNLPKDPELVTQCKQRGFTTDDYNRITLEKKKDHRAKHGSSPDRLETLMMLFADWDPVIAARPTEGTVTTPGELERYAARWRRYDKLGTDKMHKQPDVFKMARNARQQAGDYVPEPYHWEKQKPRG